MLLGTQYEFWLYCFFAISSRFAIAQRTSYVNVALYRTKTTVRTLVKNSLDYHVGLVNASRYYLWDDLGWWENANCWTTVINADLYNGTQTYRQAVATMVKSAPICWFEPGLPFYNTWMDDTGFWALMFVQAAKAYPGDAPQYWAQATEMFWYMYNRGVIRPEDFRYMNDGTGRLEAKTNVTFESECNGNSMLGGIYWRADFDDRQIGAVSAGLFSQLGAELCDYHSNMTYCEIARRSLDWTTRNLRQSNGVIGDHVDSINCTVVPWVFTYNVGLYMIAHAKLAQVTNNNTMWQYAVNLAQGVMAWSHIHNKDGVLIEGYGDPDGKNELISFKGVWVRALLNLRQLTNSTTLQSSIDTYMSIQYWALTQLASDSTMQPLRYTRNWTGPYTVSTQISQAVALDVVVGMLQTNQNYLSLDDLAKPVAGVAGRVRRRVVSAISDW